MKKRINQIKHILTFTVIMSSAPLFSSKAIFLLSDLRVGLEIDLCSAINNIHNLEKNSSFKNIPQKTSIRNTTNFGIGIMAGYNFIGLILPEIGIRLMSKQVMGAKGIYSIEERFVEIPLRLSFTISIIPFVLKFKIIAGYKHNFLLSADYNVEDEKIAKSTTQKNIHKKANYPKSSGNALFGLGLGFPYDTYCNLIINIPLDHILNNKSNVFNENKIRDMDFSKFNSLSPDTILIHRLFSTPIVEFQIGINLAQFFI